MKKLIILLIASIVLFSCKKTNDNYSNGVNSGGNILPNTTTVSNTDLFGTKWVLTKYQNDSLTISKSDTIKFVDNYTYKLNSQSDLFQYSVMSVDSTKQRLVLYNFKPILDYNLIGTISANIEDSVRIDSTRFRDLNINNSNGQKFYLWFVRI